MDKPRFVHKVGGRDSLSIVWVAVVLLVCMGVVSAQNSRLTAPTVKYLMQEGQRLYDQGSYSTAEEILRQASDYQQSLEKSDQKKLAKLLDKTHSAVVARESALKDLNFGRELAQQGKSAEASVYLKKVKRRPLFDR